MTIRKHRMTPLWVLLASLTVVANSSGEDRDLSSQSYHLSGAEIPRYYLVGNFFRHADAFIKVDQRNQDYFIEQIGLEVGSKAEQAFLRAVEKAVALERDPDRTTTKFVQRSANSYDIVEHASRPGPERQNGESIEAFMVRQRQYEVSRGRQLADIYYELERDLADEGFPMTGIESFIDSRVAPGSGLSADHPLDVPMPVPDAFEDQYRQRSREARKE